MQPVIEAGHFLNDQLSSAQRALIPTTLKQAYKAADDLAKDHPILGVTSAVDNRGRLRAWATDFGIERLIKTGQWPFEYEWSWFDKPTGRYLRVRLEASVMSISLVENPQYPPRHANFRANNAVGNPPLLFPEPDDERKVVGVPGFILVHGHQSPEFAHIGMPHPVRRRWLYKTSNLMMTPHQIPDDLPPVEAEDEEAILSLKDEIAKWLRDNDVQ